ncbi:hypothetical protein [Streptomyces drozdowiczii]|uniref:DUF3846 domain-containing protein n=1 Tax=Streptomyces drozdowiczii TaxID=202862 RepID=A0ABY6Q2L8_9ACTN|nr:hypothetical protein [Streptomyces drozdowiczii]MCX0248019.1 DUF3846 domain-containing protein [Streptomyces drozdowiczii]UZK58281.1 DUF3846 domain-containing protein [Streptomyces drozdowiczii]
MSEARFALILRPGGSFDVIDWPTELAAGLTVLAQEFRTLSIAALGLWPDCSMWTDAEAAQGTAPLNRFAERVHCAAGLAAEHYYGSIALTGGLTDADDGTHTGLTLDACREFLKLAEISVPRIPHLRTK